MIRRLEVKGLNNQDDGNFNFHFHEDLNIFTGANGSGKTTLLKLIWYFISGHLKQILSEIPFTYLSIETEPFSIVMDRQKPEEFMLTFEYSSNTRSESGGRSIKIDPETNTIEQRSVDNVNKLEKRIAESSKGSLFFPTFRRIEGGFSIGSRSSAHTEDVAGLRLLSSTTERLLTALSQLSDDMSTERHKFIVSVSTMDIIKLLPEKYVGIYQEISNRQSQVLTNISREIQRNPDKDTIGEIPESASSVLDAIQKVDKETEQMKRPLSVLSELTRKIFRYNAILVTEKLVLGGKNDGIAFREGSEDITIEEIDEAISSDKLSSGEKQMLSYLCYNAFYKDTAIFIDEPELSLHVDWQRRLFPTLLEQGKNNQFFVATHSPFIYTKYPDKEFLLDEDRGES
ncbi:MAG: AAA family ATPase [Candidatus Poribacteria bacterium]|nr:AAA family ATPase [Candidatus Poribacteria bacterium]MDE0322338.1 AAA family ATPase [Candidatus Poribacteria bacterium]